MIRRPLILAIALAMALVAGAGKAAAQSVGVSSPLNRHNLSTTGPGPLRSDTVTEICIFCHTPHNAQPRTPLWNQALPAGVTYTPYSSSTMMATPGQPTGASKLCLSCHDGTIAVGRLPGSPRLTGASMLGTNLANDHPISFVPTAGPQVVLPPPGDSVRLDASGELQCTSCHDPHEQERDSAEKKFLVKTNQSSALCVTCHIKAGWSANPTSHRLSAKPYTAAQGAHTAFTTVATNACESCHKPHSASWPERLLKDQEAMTCGTGNSQCHGGTAVAQKNIYSEVTGKPYAHPSYDLISAQTHDPSESPTNTRVPLPERSLTTNRHAACSDCHDPHASYPQAAIAPKAPGQLAGVWGVRVDGMVSQPQGVPPTVHEYEICFKCHANSMNRPQRAGLDNGFGPLPVRQVNEFNLRNAFDPNGVSFHPVAAVGRNNDVPSLLTGWTTASQVYCTDCHDNDDGPNAPGGSTLKPKGPHASRWPHLMVAQYVLDDNQPYTPTNYALCYKCHGESILMDETRSAFALHRKHVMEGRTPCFVCHDAHGVRSGVPITQTKLINFAVTGANGGTIVAPSSSGRLEYVSTGPRQGQCYLTCHGRDHNPLEYRGGL